LLDQSGGEGGAAVRLRQVRWQAHPSRPRRNPGGEDRLLAAEQRVELALGNPGAARDLLGADRGITPLQQEAESGVENPRATRVAGLRHGLAVARFLLGHRE